MADSESRLRRPPRAALFSFGFRPFFLFAAIWSALAVPIWIAALTGGGGLVVVDRDWHVHEMLFGYLGGVVAGFLLTAVANWTGRAPVRGAALTGLFSLWLAARIAGLLPIPAGVAAVADGAFFIALAGVIWREVLAGGNRRNLPICLLVSLLAAADLTFHLRGGAPEVGVVAERAALAIAAMLIVVIGGRIIPTFTRNWLAQRQVRPPPVEFNGVDKAILALTGAALIVWVFAGAAPWAGLLLMAAGLANGVRLLRWRGWKTGSEALVWILHLGYLWLSIGLVLLGTSLVFPSAVPLTAGVHALTAGAIGVMTLAVMTRASRGHTGRPLAADRWTTVIYVSVLAAAVIRVAAPFFPSQGGLLMVSAGLWTAAFAGFALCYGPMLVGPRRAG